MKVGVSSLFVGQHEHSLDRKGRVVLPAPFRASVAERGVVTSLGPFIGLWSQEGFRTVAERWKKELEAGNISTQVFRKLMNDVADVKLDSAGRITLPRELLDELGFESQVVVGGMYDRVEIWPLDKYRENQDDDVADELAAAISRLGL